MAATVKRRNVDRLIWKPEWEGVLVHHLKSMMYDSRYCLNGNWRSGYQKVLQDFLARDFPGAGIKVKPHINSKIDAWKKLYHQVDKLVHRTGFTWNAESCTPETTNAVWEDIASRDRSLVQAVRGKGFPFYEDWKIIFSKQRGQGGMGRAPTKLDPSARGEAGPSKSETQQLHDDKDSVPETQPPPLSDRMDTSERSSAGQQRSGEKRKSRHGSSSMSSRDDGETDVQILSAAMRETGHIVAAAVREVAAGIYEQGRNQRRQRNEVRQRISEMNLPGGINVRMFAMTTIGANDNYMDLFLSMDRLAEREAFVTYLLNQHFQQ